MKARAGSFLKIFFLFLTVNLFAIDFDEDGDVLISDNPPQFVSLGANCELALVLRTNGLRKAAFPFDWLLTVDHESFLKILNEDFFFFTDDNYFKRYEGTPINLYYKTCFPHDAVDWISDIGIEQWDNFKTKYDRRVNRFRQLREYPGKVFFVRTFWTGSGEGANGEFNENTKRAQETKDALDLYFPLLDFTLIIVSYNDLNIPPLQGLEGVVEFRIERPHPAFQAMANSLLAQVGNK